MFVCMAAYMPKIPLLIVVPPMHCLNPQINRVNLFSVDRRCWHQWHGLSMELELWKKHSAETQTLRAGCRKGGAKIIARRRPPSRGRGTPKFNQLQMVTTFIYKPSLVRIDQRWAQGSFVEAEAEVKAERSRHRRGKAAMFLTEARQGRGEAEWNRRCLCGFDIMHNAHVVVTCSCFVVNYIYQWKTLHRSFITNTIYTVIVL